MQEFNIRDKCHVNSNRDSDVFVGLKCDNGDISINFPIGYAVSKDNKELRKDILLLFGTLQANTERKDSEKMGDAKAYQQMDFPMQAYMYIIRDYYVRGYYKDYEIQHNVAKKGKTSWSKTIKTVKPYFQDDMAYYLSFITKKNTMKDNELITLIHEYCVYDSFGKIGWLITSNMPAKPRIKLNSKLFISVIAERLTQTFNDRNKLLFKNMLAVVKQLGDKDSLKNYRYGTYRFEYVWERMIDKAFGIENKADYFPKTTWSTFKRIQDNASLEPDTIMLHQGKIYVIDAKYYKYGYSGIMADLPKSTSINKQITYGEYIAEQLEQGKEKAVYNAFLMPFDKVNAKYFKSDNDIKYIGEATSSWKENQKQYEKIEGILVDVKYLMNISLRQDQAEIMKLADVIEKAEFDS